MISFDIIGGETLSRIYINEHLPPLCLKLTSLCRKMKNNGKITKFIVFNNDLSKMSLTTNGGARASYGLYIFLHRSL
uniref:Uncharacterized protein n=1 Tax=Glossina palpalis gambiensis TaxID=67801 RepID=A0A1B0C674_9MUSC